VSFGITELDKLLGGGLTKGSTNYLEVERGVKELSFVAAFLEEGLRQRDFCGINLYDMPSQPFIDRLAELGLNIQDALDSGSLIMADLSSEGEYDPERRGPILKTNNLADPSSLLRIFSDLSEVGRSRTESRRFSGLRLVGYSSSTLFLNYKFDVVYKMIKAARMQIRLNKVVNLTTFNPKMFDESIVAAVEGTCDSIISLTVKEIDGKFQRFIRVRDSPIHTFLMDEVPYDIVDGRPMLKLP
jgi:KaiC/GvpD/RAD55 family RecA-like ATPase